MQKAKNSTQPSSYEAGSSAGCRVSIAFPNPKPRVWPAHEQWISAYDDESAFTCQQLYVGTLTCCLYITGTALLQCKEGNGYEHVRASHESFATAVLGSRVAHAVGFGCIGTGYVVRSSSWDAGRKGCGMAEFSCWTKL